ncbi:ligase-associated DNA damage response endonuclease PdeM [Enhydrobacter sp.]|jgi:DNA ligase-associated metallophosphoesterase|uniref:ligase-associated DNA damage response endonuclease PdeM n=1 Tax=Enhydrobacter sp. TaxID=1894999 RepID=UPI002624C58C|nr:ligase-associated DNA damage response endonuclease PdeM [Enhydrobacter sp.]WIM13161.1 MAG: ICC-like protein phosphoesterase [Enhydrobacter sp.]
MTGLAFLCAGERLEALPMGALHWPGRRLIAVADLHLEKGSSYAVNARKLLPRHDTRQTLVLLGKLIDTLRPETVVCLGDSFHDREAVDRLPTIERAEIERLTRLARFVWIAGNHDPAPPPDGWGHVAEEIADAPLVFRHEALFGAADGEISGHYHPVAALTVRGRGLRRRCFLTDGRRVILPAFGAYAGGLNALDPAIAQLFPDDYDALVVGRDTVRRLSWRQLRPDATLASLARVREVR